MPGPIYVIGHKNSDLDSVASAYAYARLLQLQGEEQAIPARHGELKPEVRFVLERYQVEPPEALEDVFLQVRDVMRRGVISARVNQPLLEAGQLLQEHNRRSMPVVDSENKVQGIIAVEDFAGARPPRARTGRRPAQAGKPRTGGSNAGRNDGRLYRTGLPGGARGP